MANTPLWHPEIARLRQAYHRCKGATGVVLYTNARSCVSGIESNKRQLEQPNRRIRDPYVRWCGLSITHNLGLWQSAFFEDGDVSDNELLNECPYPGISHGHERCCMATFHDHADRQHCSGHSLYGIPCRS